jgi:hypothetical protein
MYTSYHDVPPPMMLLYLIMAAIFVASKWMGAPQEGKKEVCGIDFGKSDFSRFILINSILAFLSLIDNWCFRWRFLSCC